LILDRGHYRPPQGIFDGLNNAKANLNNGIVTSINNKLGITTPAPATTLPPTTATGAQQTLHLPR